MTPRGHLHPSPGAERFRARLRARSLFDWAATPKGRTLTDSEVADWLHAGLEVPFKDMLRYVRNQSGTRDISGSCRNKQFVPRWTSDEWPPRHYWMIVRCQTKCTPCLNRRRYQWMDRAKVEMTKSARCWLLTLTFKQSSRDWLASHSAATSTSPTELAYRQVSEYVKRVRKTASGDIRYLFTVENHKDGTPHLHGLIFEKKSGSTTWRKLHAAWPNGFVSAQLADAGSIFYVCKYAMKNDLKVKRMRASKKFGQDDRS